MNETQELIEQIIRGLDLLGVVANALLGAAVARQFKLDPVGFAILSIVSALGGGAILNEQTQAQLASGEHTVVLLVASPEAIKERISGKSNRPLLSGIDSWVETYEARRETYERLADLTVDTSFRPMWQVSNEVHRYLKRVGSPLIRNSTPAQADN